MMLIVQLLLQFLFDLLGVDEFAPSNRLMQLFDYLACDETMREKHVCENIMFLTVGFDDKQMNMVIVIVASII